MNNNKITGIDTMYKKSLNFCTYVLLVSCLFSISTPSLFANSFVQRVYNRVFSKGGLAYFVTAGLYPYYAMPIHELGHALANKFLINKPIDIHLGANPRDIPDKPVWKGAGVTVHSLNFWKGGFCQGNISYPVTTKDHLKSMAITAAGPLLEYASVLGLYKLTQLFEEKNKKEQEELTIRDWIRRGMVAPMLASALSNLTPAALGGSESSDGNKIYQHIKEIWTRFWKKS